MVELKQTAGNFLLLVAGKDVRKAYEKYVAPGFIHHNAYFRGDANSLMVAMEENALRNPEKVLRIQRTAHEGNLVFIHSKVNMKPNDKGIALVHIFRFEGALIAELWDIGQPMPDDSPNENGMF